MPEDGFESVWWERGDGIADPREVKKLWRDPFIDMGIADPEGQEADGNIFRLGDKWAETCPRRPPAPGP